MFILSGVFYPISALPPGVQAVVQLLPLTHAVQLVRPLVSGQALTDVGLHVAVIVGYALVAYYFAVVLVRKRLVV